ncbi:DNA repair protein XRCC3 isoform X1 [Paramormyrops kingsleyae]|uniref:DNA repair protein n=1 Tax=Paramormyrops kingsleyae TaxID=1676925 RepID=A0A3B3SB88_9TELE|nr:DNA repair protein XRCC3 isoform X1 [Paramormyrops kingsleyae]XP_023649051.1 DNA repair protein XRCC3 isoform X1 [Paramormyrops kingsleyae]
MDFRQLELNPRIISAAKKANLRSARDILGLSGPDLQRLTRLSMSDVQRLQAAVAVAYRRSPPVTALQLYRGECPALEPRHRLTLGCPTLDRLMRGGIPLSGITELAGESGAGKTQIGLQLCLTVQYPQVHGGLGSGAVYICTEDTFPIKRLRQLITQQPRLRPELPTDLLHGLCFSDNIYIEHAADLGVLQTCLSQRVPILLARGLARLVVLDSVAALFRCEFTAEESSERARHLVALASTLQRLSHSFNAPVLCINQVTDVVEHCDASQFRCGLVESPVLPALGMAWANQLLVRLMMRRLGGVPSLEAAIGVPRRLEVVYAPHLPRASCLCHIGEEGVRGDLSPDSAHIVSSHMDL